jgi:hypothetical protein
VVLVLSAGHPAEVAGVHTAVPFTIRTRVTGFVGARGGRTIGVFANKPSDVQGAAPATAFRDDGPKLTTAFGRLRTRPDETVVGIRWELDLGTEPVPQRR